MNELYCDSGGRALRMIAARQRCTCTAYLAVNRAAEHVHTSALLRPVGGMGSLSGTPVMCHDAADGVCLGALG